MNPTFNEMPIVVIRDHNKIFYYKKSLEFFVKQLLFISITPISNITQAFNAVSAGIIMFI